MGLGFRVGVRVRVEVRVRVRASALDSPRSPSTAPLPKATGSHV